MSKSAQRIKEAREFLGFSQEEVSKYLGLHRPAISEIEAGNRRVHAEELLKLSKLLCRSVAWLAGDEETPPLTEALAAMAAGLPPEDIEELATFADYLRHRRKGVK